MFVEVATKFARSNHADRLLHHSRFMLDESWSAAFARSNSPYFDIIRTLEPHHSTTCQQREFLRNPSES